MSGPEYAAILAEVDDWIQAEFPDWVYRYNHQELMKVYGQTTHPGRLATYLFYAQQDKHVAGFWLMIHNEIPHIRVTWNGDLIPYNRENLLAECSRQYAIHVLDHLNT